MLWLGVFFLFLCGTGNGFQLEEPTVYSLDPTPVCQIILFIILFLFCSFVIIMLIILTFFSSGSRIHLESTSRPSETVRTGPPHLLPHSLSFPFFPFLSLSFPFFLFLSLSFPFSLTFSHRYGRKDSQ